MLSVAVPSRRAGFSFSRLFIGSRYLQCCHASGVATAAVPDGPRAQADSVRLILPRVREFVKAHEACVLTKSWGTGDSLTSLFDLGRENLEVLLQVEGAQKYVTRPVPWMMEDRAQLGREVCLHIATLGITGRTTPVHYFAVTGHRGVGKTTVLQGVMDLVHAATPRVTDGPTLFPLGLFKSPVIVGPVDPARPYDAPPELRSTGGALSTIPLPPVLHAVEVLRAYGFRELPGFREVAARSGGTNELNWACWHPDAFRPDALERLSAWCLEQRVHPVVMIDEFQSVFATGNAPAFTALWHAQLVTPTYGTLEPSALFCLSGSSAYTNPILFNVPTLEGVKELGALPHPRGAVHGERVLFNTLSSAKTLEDMKWMVMNSLWPSKANPVAEAVFNRSKPALSPRASANPDSDSMRGGDNDTDPGNRGSKVPTITPDAVLRATLGLPRLLSIFANSGELTIVERRSMERMNAALDQGLRTIYLAIASDLSRKGAITTQLSVSPLQEDRPLWVSRPNFERSVELLRDHFVKSTGVLPSWFRSGSLREENLRYWAELGLLSYRSVGDTIGFPAPVFLAYALEELASLTYNIDPEIVRMVFKPEGRTAIDAGEPIVASTLCHPHKGMSSLGHLSDHLVRGAELPEADFALLQDALRQADFTWTTQDVPSPMDGLRSTRLAAEWRFGSPTSHLVPYKLYRPMSDSFGSDVFAAIISDAGPYCIIWIILCQIKLSRGSDNTFVFPSDVSAAAARFAVAIGSGATNVHYQEIVQLAKQLAMANKPAHVRPVVLFATNRRASQKTVAAAHTGGEAPANSTHTSVDGIVAKAHNTGLLVPRTGAGLLLTRDDLAPYWAPPIRLLAHEQDLPAYGGKLTVEEAAALTAELVKHGSARNLIIPTAMTRKEEAMKAEHERGQKLQNQQTQKAEEELKRAEEEQKRATYLREEYEQQNREYAKLAHVLSQRQVSPWFVSKLLDAGVTAAAIEVHDPSVVEAIDAARLPASLKSKLGFVKGE